MKDGTVVSYRTPFADSVQDAFRLDDTPEGNANFYSQNKVFDFAEPEQAFSDIKEKMTNSGYEVTDVDYSYYALDAQTMAEQEVNYDKTGEQVQGAGRKWLDEDNCYYFFAQQMYQGLPVYFCGPVVSGDSIDERPIQAIFSERGLEQLEIMGLYNFTSLEEKIQWKNFEDIVKNVAAKYGDILTGVSYEVKRAKLYQMPVKTKSDEYDVRVVWLFEIHESGVDSELGENVENVLYTFVDAQTGEEVIL